MASLNEELRFFNQAVRGFGGVGVCRVLVRAE